MQRKYRMVLFSNASSSMRELIFSKFHIVVIALVCFLIIASITSVSVNVLSNYLYSFRLNLLSQERTDIRAEIKGLSRDYELLSSRLNELFESGDELRREINLGPLDPSLQQVGLGGGTILPSNQSEFFFSELEMLTDISSQLAKLKILVDSQESSFASIEQGLQEHMERLRYFPSIPPAHEGRIYLSDKFGPREDPLSGGVENHKGLDIRGNIGNSVHTTADGTIMELHRSNQGDLGIYVKISHNHKKYGYITKYGHLSKIEPSLKVGSKVKRWDKIGEIGNTGRVTGPHLHYEVLYKLRAVDPEIANWHPELFRKFYADSEVKEQR